MNRLSGVAGQRRVVDDFFLGLAERDERPHHDPAGEMRQREREGSIA
jgi:hypothetical protein